MNLEDPSLMLVIDHSRVTGGTTSPAEPSVDEG